MTNRNAENERMKHRYLDWLNDAKGRDESSIDVVAAALDRFDAFNRYRPFTAFHFEQARAFKAQPRGNAKPADREAAVGVDHPRNARCAEGVLHVARQPARLRLTDQGP